MSKFLGAAEDKAALLKLRKQVDHWRANKKTQTEAMPKSIWNDCIDLAKRLGVPTVAREVGVENTALRRRANSELGDASCIARVNQPQFVELEQSPPERTKQRIELEIVRSDGNRVIVRCGPDEEIHVASFVESVFRWS